MEVVNKIAEKVIEGNIDQVKILTQEAVTQNVAIDVIMNEGFAHGLEVVGEKYSAGEYFLPEMLVSGMAVAGAMEILRPLAKKSGTRLKGTVIAGTVEGDIHDIGKNIVCMMLEGAGFNVVDLGVDTPAQKFVDAAKQNSADIIAMSALLSTTRANMKGIISVIRNSELSDQVKLMVGGASVTQDFADAIGADGYAPDAVLAVKTAKELLQID